MSTPSEKITAQQGAADSKPVQWWHRHLCGPIELRHLLAESYRLRTANDCIELAMDALYRIGTGSLPALQGQNLAIQSFKLMGAKLDLADQLAKELEPGRDEAGDCGQSKIAANGKIPEGDGGTR